MVLKSSLLLSLLVTCNLKNQVGLLWLLNAHKGFPGASVVKSAWQCRRWRSHSWVRKIPWRRAWQPTPVFLPGKFQGQRSLVGYTPWSLRELYTAERPRTHKLNENKSVIRLSEVILQQNKDKGKISKVIRNERNIIYKKKVMNGNWIILRNTGYQQGVGSIFLVLKQKLAST